MTALQAIGVISPGEAIIIVMLVFVLLKARK